MNKLKSDKAPKTMKQFSRWLQDVFDKVEFLCKYVDPNFYDEMEVGNYVTDASRFACRFGAGHLAALEATSMPPSEGLVVLGRLMAWTSEQLSEPSDLLSVGQVANKLNVSVRTVWRRVSANKFPAPIPVGGSTRWKADDVQAWIELQ